MAFRRAKALRGAGALVASVFLLLSGIARAQETGLLPDGRLVLSAAADRSVNAHREKVSGRFGALAVSQDATSIVSYLCQSRLWKNCDDPAGEDSNIAIPSGKVARDEALTRCRDQSGSACILLFVNDDEQREFSVRP
ncbi:MAG: hypothetical protein ACREEP_10100 [Dongiaceae bacterium]